ncbi:MAG TPA: sigma 54-interacting transcriptional regulator [Urbifossiella sp.]|nr:sigma 54-interacting transcriptional regulator [Urbifossiella sp.]
MSDPPRKGRPKGAGGFTWRSFFHRSTTPVFVLGKNRRLRYANPAWERLAGVTLAESLGLVCSARRHATPLAAALAPTPDALAGRPDAARRPAPPNRTGPPWWDITFVPLAAADGLHGIVGSVRVVGEPVRAAARVIPAAVAAVREKHAAGFTPDLLPPRLAAQLRLAGQTAAPVWLIGEPGSGKATAARVVHHAGAAREKMFVRVGCGELQPYLVESLFWGHGGLAGTDRVGTVYLADPAALSRDIQQQLLDLFTDDQPGTPRLVCGSPRPAATDVAAGRLLPEFHTLLSVLEITVPPLRDRADERPRLVSRLLDRSGAPPDIEPAAVEVLAAQPWPGNVRELAATVAEAVAAAAGGPVKREHLPRELRVRAGLEKPAPEPPLALEPAVAALEERLIRRALARTRGNVTKAADLLGIPRGRLLRRMTALGLSSAPDDLPPATS